jgi:hypothetical protein
MDLAIVFLLIFNINVSHTVKLGAGKNDAPFLAFVLLCTFAVWDAFLLNNHTVLFIENNLIVKILLYVYEPGPVK